MILDAYGTSMKPLHVILQRESTISHHSGPLRHAQSPYIPPYISRAFYVLLERAVMSSCDTSIRWLASSPFLNARLAPSRACLQTSEAPSHAPARLLHVPLFSVAETLFRTECIRSVGVRESSIVSTGHPYSFSLLVFRYDHRVCILEASPGNPSLSSISISTLRRPACMWATSPGPPPSVWTSYQPRPTGMHSQRCPYPPHTLILLLLWFASTLLCDASQIGLAEMCFRLTSPKWLS